jgi:hypothetical protein
MVEALVDHQALGEEDWIVALHAWFSARNDIRHLMINA